MKMYSVDCERLPFAMGLASADRFVLLPSKWSERCFRSTSERRRASSFCGPGNCPVGICRIPNGDERGRGKEIKIRLRSGRIKVVFGLCDVCVKHCVCLNERCVRWCVGGW